jgi:hypothetical protein
LINTYTYHTRFNPEGVAKALQIFLIIISLLMPPSMGHTMFARMYSPHDYNSTGTGTEEIGIHTVIIMGIVTD